jgi:iron complex outermembrane receptor protein
MFAKCRSLAAIALAGIPAAAWPQSVQQLPEVAVTAERDAQGSLTLPGIDAAREELRRIPGGATIVDSEEFRAGRVSTLADTLGFAPGVFVQPRFGADEARLSIRGSGIQRTFHLRGIRLLQDGVPLNLADGGGDFQAVEPLAARFIEVFRGANALEYGAATLGGAINYVSYSGYDGSAFQARGEGGSFGYLRGQLSTAQVWDNVDLYATATYSGQDGFRDHAEQSTNRQFVNLGVRLNDQLETRFFLARVDTDSELPGNLTKAQLNTNPRQANPANVTGDQKRDFDLYRVSNVTSYRAGATLVQGLIFYSYKDLFHPIFQVLEQESDDWGASVRVVNDTPLAGFRNRLVAGLNWQRGETRDDRFVNVGGRPGARTNQTDQVAENLEIYAEDQLYVLPRVAAVLGLQWARAERDLTDLYVTTTNESFSRTYERFSPKYGLLYELDPQTQIFGNYSKSFEPPSFGELVIPNVNRLQPQTASTLEVGTRGSRAGIDWDLALYRAEVKNELLSLNDGAGNPLGTVNALSTRHQGIELGFTARIGPVRWRQAYLYNDFRFDNDPVYGDNRLPGLPRQWLKAELLYQWGEGYYAGPVIEASPDSYPVDMANTLYADSFTLWGFKVGRVVGRGLSWFIEGRNLGDEKYASATGVIANARGMDSAQFLPGDGRSVYAGLEWRQ